MVMSKARSSFVVPSSTGSRPESGIQFSAVWKIGCTDGSRCGSTASTIFWNGVCPCSMASIRPLRTRPSSAANVGSPETSQRSATGLTNMPISGVSSGLSRPAVETPTTTSASPEIRDSSAAKPASSTMYGVACAPVASAPTRSSSPSGSVKRTSSPANPSWAGRGRSSGRPVTGGAPAR